MYQFDTFLNNWMSLLGLNNIKINYLRFFNEISNNKFDTADIVN